MQICRCKHWSHWSLSRSLQFHLAPVLAPSWVQCDQMTILFVQYLTNTIKNLLNGIKIVKIGLKFCSLQNNPSLKIVEGLKSSQSGKFSPMLFTLLGRVLVHVSDLPHIVSILR